MRDISNELSKLKALRDGERKQLAVFETQRDRAVREQEQRLSQLDAEIERIRAAVGTWVSLIGVLEEQRDRGTIVDIVIETEEVSDAS